MIRILGTLILTLSLHSAFAAPTVDELLTAMQTNNNMTSDIKAKVSMTQQKSGQGVKTSEMIYYRRDKDDAFLIVMIAPESDKGNGYLRMGDNFWMYRRNTRTFQHINRDESIGGSDAKGEDFESRPLTELYGPEKDTAGVVAVTEEKLGAIPVYKFKVAAKVVDVNYPRKTFWVRTDNKLVLKEESYAKSGTLMMTAYYIKYSEIDKRFVPVKQMFVDEFEKGNKTIVEISGISTDKLSEELFTKAYLENLSK